MRSAAARSGLFASGLLIGGLLIGGLLGLVGGFLQAQRLIIAGVPIIGGPVAVPWGAAVACLGVLIVVRGAVVGTGTRWAGWGVLAGWLGASLVLAAESPSGDIAISGGVRQWTYLVLTVVVGSAVATLPARLRNPVPRGDVGP